MASMFLEKMEKELPWEAKKGKLDRAKGKIHAEKKCFNFTQKVRFFHSQKKYLKPTIKKA